uniref:BMERB domain-containing protein n=1 Tax=Romanomermis culicivorax TaxID=13658 RepID=A0A915KUY6_ROMCU
MNEYLSLLNERNMLTRREMHFTLLENVDEQETKFHDVQRQLADLLKMDDSEKTEAHKIKIDQLMAELITCVNKRDELMQQLMANEQAQDDEAQLANDVMSQSTILMPNRGMASAQNNGEKESCCVQ